MNGERVISCTIELRDGKWRFYSIAGKQVNPNDYCYVWLDSKPKKDIKSLPYMTEGVKNRLLTEIVKYGNYINFFSVDAPEEDVPHFWRVATEVSEEELAKWR